MDWMNWTSIGFCYPGDDLGCYDVTIQAPDLTRLTNVAIFRKKDNSWELMIDKYHFQDCKVIAWKERAPPYKLD